MQFNRNTFSTENLLFDDPPPFLNPSIFIKPFFISNPSHSSPSPSLNYVSRHQPPPTKDGIAPHRVDSSTDSSHSLLSLPILPLIDSDFDFSWLAENVDFSTASSTCVKASSVSTTASASASAPSASVSAPLLQDGASGFDQLSLLDEACSSGLNTPFTPQMDTPDQTPSQTPMIDCVASDDDLASLDLFWTSSPASVAAPVASTLVDDASRLQAENALLDFVLFDDIAPTSPISTFSTPMTASITSPSVDLKEIETHELAMQLVASAANMTSSTVISPIASPFVCGSSDVIGSLFSDASLTSPLSDSTAFSTPAVSPISPPQSFVSHAQDWTSTSMNQSFLFDFGVTSIPTMASLPDMVNTTPSPSVDLNLLLSLYSQQASGLMSLSAATMLTSTPAPASAPASANPLKRKSDEIQASQAGEESPRQFACAQCGRAFSRLFNLNTHERTHDRSKARLFACPEQGCKKSFTRKNDLQRHQISIHKVTHIYSCKNCDSPFQRKDALRRHMDECSVVASSSLSDHEHAHAHDHHSHSN